MSIGVEQFPQVFYLRLQFPAPVSVGNEKSAPDVFHYLHIRLNVATLTHRVLNIGERLVLHQFKLTAMVHQCVACDTSLFVVWLSKSAVNDHQLTVSSYWAFAACHVNRHVSVDDVAVCACHSEGIEYGIGSLLLVTQSEEGTLCLHMGLFIGKEIAFEGCHFSFVEEARVLSAP